MTGRRRWAARPARAGSFTLLHATRLTWRDPGCGLCAQTVSIGAVIRIEGADVAEVRGRVRVAVLRVPAGADVLRVGDAVSVGVGLAREEEPGSSFRARVPRPSARGRRNQRRREDERGGEGARTHGGRVQQDPRERESLCAPDPRVTSADPTGHTELTLGEPPGEPATPEHRAFDMSGGPGRRPLWRDGC